MALRMQRTRETIKGILDRRYLTKESGIESRLSSLADEVTELSRRVEELSERAHRVERRADELVRSVEHLLQVELIVRRDLDRAVPGQSIDPDRSSPDRR